MLKTMVTIFGEYGLDRIVRVKMPEPERNLLPHCPMENGPVMLTVCEACPHHGGYVDTRNIGSSSRRYRILCLYGRSRAIRLIGTEPFVACPKFSCKVREARKCATCDHFDGIRRTPRGLLDRLLGRGVQRIACTHP